MYEFVGREAPFLILAGLAVLDGCMYHPIQYSAIRSVSVRFLFS